MKLTKKTIQFMIENPEAGPFVVTHYAEGNTVNSRAREIARDQLGIKISVSREKFILVDPQTAQAQNVWKVRIEKQRQCPECRVHEKEGHKPGCKIGWRLDNVNST